MKTLKSSTSQLMYLCEINDIQSVKNILETNKEDINSVDRDYHTCLFAACININIELVELLLANGADINHRNIDCESVIMITCRLYEDIKDDYKCSQLKKLIKLLIAKGADVNQDDIFEKTTLLHMIDLNDHIDIIKILLDSGADVNHYGGDGETALIKVCCGLNVNIELVKLLLEYGANVNHICFRHGTPLSIACKKSNLKLINLLVAYGANTSE